MRAVSYRRLVRGVALFAAVLGLGACGGSSKDAPPPASNEALSSAAVVAAHVSEPNAVVVRVAGHAITKAMYAHELFRAERLSEGPNPVALVPPDFDACVSRLKAANTVHGASAADLKAVCAERYETVKARALDRLIVYRWVLGAAAEVGVSVDRKALEQEMRKAEHEPSPAALKKVLATTGRTKADLERQFEAQQLEEAIRAKLTSETAHVSEAQVAAYYRANRSRFGTPEGRDLLIARVGKLAEAEKIKREIAAGASFPDVVKKLPLQQPIYSNDALVVDYQSGMYHEPPLNDAIFAARPGVLSGPVRINLGYYVFEVTKIIPPVQKSLAQVRATIRGELPAERYQQALVGFLKRWRARWTARTDCSRGYVVQKCRQYGSPTEQEDLYTFD